MMDIQNLFFQILPFLAIVSIFIGWLQNRRDKKLGIKKEEKPSRLKLWFKKTYLYKIFIERASLRPIPSAFLYAIFVVPACFICLFGVVFIDSKPSVQLNKMQKVEGIITNVVWIKRGKGRDYIEFIRIDNKNKESYPTNLDAKSYKKLLKYIGKKVNIFLYNDVYINIFLRKATSIYEVKYKDKYLLGYDYESRIKTDNKIKNFFYSTWFGLKIALIGLFFIFLLNYKEKPIHRLNRMKKYLKDKNQKKEK